MGHSRETRREVCLSKHCCLDALDLMALVDHQRLRGPLECVQVSHAEYRLAGVYLLLRLASPPIGAVATEVVSSEPRMVLSSPLATPGRRDILLS